MLKSGLCDGFLILYTDLCQGCEEYSVNVGGICTKEQLTWTCDGENILLETQCKGFCPVGRFLFNNLCEQEVWRCKGKLQLLETPCKGSCFSDEFCFSNETCLPQVV